MVTSKDLVVRFVSDTSNWKSGLNKVKSDISGFSSAETGITTASKKMGASIGGVGHSLAGSGGLGAAFKGAGGALSGFLGQYGGMLVAGAGIAAVVGVIVMGMKKMVSTAMEAETMVNRMAIYFGGSKKLAKEAYLDILKFARETGKSTSELMQSYFFAQSYGMNAMQKGMGGMKGSLLKLATGMSEISGKSVAEAMTDLMNPMQRGLKEYGKSALIAFKAASKFGEAGTDIFRSHFINEMSKIPAYMADADQKANSMKDIFGSMGNSIQTMFLYMSGFTSEKTGSFWEGLKNSMRSIADWLNKAIESARPYFEEIGQYLGSMFNMVWEILKLAFTILKPFFQLSMVLGHIGRMILMPIFNMISAFLSGLTKILNALFEGLGKFTFFKDLFTGAGEFASNIMTKIQIIGVFLKRTWDSMIDSMVSLLKDLPTTMSKIPDKIENSLNGSPIMYLMFKSARMGIRGVGDIYDWIAGNDEQPVTPTGPMSKVTNNNSSTIDNSSTTTNMFDRKFGDQDWHIKNPYDVTGKPAFGWQQ